MIPFTVEERDGRARTGTLRTRRGAIHTPVFLPVATQGSVKALSQEDLDSLGARIIHVAEAFDSMTSRRSYSQPRAPGAALDEMRRCSGTQFDPQVVEALVKALARAGKSGRGQAERPARSLPELLRDLTGRIGIDDANPYDSGNRAATSDLD